MFFLGFLIAIFPTFGLDAKRMYRMIIDSDLTLLDIIGLVSSVQCGVACGLYQIVSVPKEIIFQSHFFV